MRKMLSILALFFALTLTASAANAAYISYSSGPLNSFDVDFFIDSTGPGDITEVTYDLSMTSSYATGNPNLVIGPPVWDVFGPAGGTATYYENSVTEFGFTFTSFNSGDSFSFGWDPDIAINAFYGAVIQELVGTKVTLYTTAGTLYGVMEIDPTQDHLVTAWAAVPEPSTMLLLGSGLIGLVFVRRKFKA